MLDLAKMTVHSHFDWLKWCCKRQPLFAFGFPMSLERTRVHMPRKESMVKNIQQYLFSSFQTGVFRMTMASGNR